MTARLFLTLMQVFSGGVVYTAAGVGVVRGVVMPAAISKGVGGGDT